MTSKKNITLRISLILAVVASIGAGGLAFYQSSTQIPQLRSQRDKERDDKMAEIAAREKLAGELAQTKVTLTGANEQLAKTANRADAQEKRADDLAAKLAKTAADLKDMQNQMIVVKTSLEADQTAKLNRELNDAQIEIATLKKGRTLLQRHLIALEERLGEEPDVKLPSDLKGNISVVDPKWNFVVLNIGEDQGAVQDGEMLVSRDGKLVGKVVIRTVQKDHCVADIVSGWKLGEIVEGDTVTPAHPASS